MVGLATIIKNILFNFNRIASVITRYAVGQSLLRQWCWAIIHGGFGVAMHMVAEDFLGTKVLASVPPNNSFSLDAMRSMVAAGMNIVNVPSILEKAVRVRGIPGIPDCLDTTGTGRRNSTATPMCWTSENTRRSATILSVRAVRAGGACSRNWSTATARTGCPLWQRTSTRLSRQTPDGEPVGALLSDLRDAAKGLPDVSFVGVNSIW